MEMPNPSQPKRPNYYNVLGVDFSATAEEVSKAFRQRARHLHPDRHSGANVNDWHLLHKAYTTLMENIKRQDYNETLASGNEEGEPDFTQLALPTSFKMSEKFQHRFGQWMHVDLQGALGGFPKAFLPELQKMLNGCCSHLVKEKIPLRKRKIEMSINFEEMMSSIAGVVKEPASSPAIKHVTEHLVRIIRAAKMSAHCSEVTDIHVPIIDFTGSPVNDLLFMLSLFGDSPKKNEDIERCLMVYVPVTVPQIGILRAEGSRKCSNCASSLRLIHECVSCEQQFCIKCPISSIKAPRIGVYFPRPICHQCDRKLAQRDAEDWTAKALNLLQSRTEGYTKAAMACVLIAIHTTEVLPVTQLRGVANELQKQGFHEQALLIFSVIREVSSSKHDVKVYLPVVKALQNISGKPGKSWREKWLLTLIAQQATLLADKLIAGSTVDVPDFSRMRNKIVTSVTAIKNEKETEYKALVTSSLGELEKAWLNRDLTEMLNVVTSTEVIGEDALIPNDGIEPAMKALDLFLNKRREFLPRMLPDNQCAIWFFQGYALIYNGDVQRGLDLIEKAVWSGHHNKWLSEAAIPIVLSQIAQHPSVKNEMAEVGKDILQTRQSQQIYFTSLLHILGITQEDLNPSLKSCWPELIVLGRNQAGTRKYEQSVLQQVQDGRLSYSEAGYALIDFILSACHPSEAILCLLNASLWFLKDLRSKTTGSMQQIYALKKMTLSCVEKAYYIALIALHPGMQLYASQFGLAIAAETITAAGKCATADDTKLLVELFHSVIEKGRFNPFWKMPIVSIHEGLLLNILTGRLHTEFMLHLQKDQRNGLLKSEEVKYQLYENDLQWVCPVEDKDAAREQAMEALMQAKGLSWSDISDSMCSVLSPRTPDGWLLQQQHLDGNLQFVTLTGFEFNTDSNNPCIRLNAIPAGHTQNGLFSAADIQTVLRIPKKELFPIIFSLDPPNDSQRFHPFQQLRFQPASINNTYLLHTLLQTDYLMKCFSVGSDVSAKPPFMQRDCSEGLTEKLPPHLKKVLAPVPERGMCSNKTSRFWIQADEIEFNVTQHGTIAYYRIGEVKMVVRTSPQFPGLDGKMHDIQDEDPDSPESRFANDLTENYDEISKYFPMFGRLRELCKLQTLGVILGRTLEDIQNKAIREGVCFPFQDIYSFQSVVDKISCKGQHVPRRTCTWVPAAVKIEKKDDSMRLCYGGVLLAPELKEVASIPRVKGEKSYDLTELDYSQHHTTSSWDKSFTAPREFTVRKDTNTGVASAAHNLLCSPKPIQLQSTTMIVLEVSMKEANRQVVSYLNRVLANVEGGLHGRGGGTMYQRGQGGGARGGSGGGGGRFGGGGSRGGGRRGNRGGSGDNEDGGKKRGRLWIAAAVLLSSFLQKPHENARGKYEKCQRHQIKEASKEDQNKANTLLEDASVLRSIRQQTKFRKKQQSEGKTVDGMHVAHIVGLKLMRHMLIKVDGKEVTKEDVEVVRECCSKFQNFEIVPMEENKSDHVKTDNAIVKAIDEYFKDGRISEATWKSLSSQPTRVRDIMTRLKKDYWPPVVSQRVQVLRQIVNPSNPAQNLWDM